MLARLKRTVRPTGTVTTGVMAASSRRFSVTVSVPLNSRSICSPASWRWSTVPSTARVTVRVFPSMDPTRMCSTPIRTVMNWRKAVPSETCRVVESGRSSRAVVSDAPAGTP